MKVTQFFMSALNCGPRALPGEGVSKPSYIFWLIALGIALGLAVELSLQVSGLLLN